MACLDVVPQMLVDPLDMFIGIQTWNMYKSDAKAPQ